MSRRRGKPTTRPRPVDPDKGWYNVRQAVPFELCTEASHRIGQEFTTRGISPEEVLEWSQDSFFPWLRTDVTLEAIKAILVLKLPANAATDKFAPTQIRVVMPSAPNSPLIGDPAPVAPCRWVAGVALTPAIFGNGCLAVWEGSEPQAVRQDVGDVVVMAPGTLHSATANMTGQPLLSLYFTLEN